MNKNARYEAMARLPVYAMDKSGDDWKTPDWFYNKLDNIYHFDFDPCPYQADFDGLNMEWGG